MKSMTGFGSAHFDSEELELEVNVKSVNGRYLETRIHAPREFAAFEIELKKQISKTIRRGSVDVYIQRKFKEKGIKVQVLVQQALATRWLKSYKSLEKSLKLMATDVSLKDIISYSPEVLKVEEQPIVGTKLKKALIDTAKVALEKFDKERSREGSALKKELLSLLAELEKLVKQMDAIKNEASLKLEERFHQRLTKLGIANDVDPQRFAQELVIQMDKLDVREEITRLKEHIRALRALYNAKETHGKKLDFYTQELLREVNTIGSKSQIAKLTSAVVNAKSIIERVREQVQNVE